MAHWIRKTEYHFDRPYGIIFVSPHGSDGQRFFRSFSEISQHPAICSLGGLWPLYLKIERDGGASELAHATAAKLCRLHPHVGCLVLELDYPRGLLDGGRTLDHCLRSSLPEDLASRLRPQFCQIHQGSLLSFEALYKDLAAKGNHLLVDLHTMASFCPRNERDERECRPVRWHEIHDYVEQFLKAPRSSANLRAIDLIGMTPDGDQISDEKLRSLFVKSLSDARQSFTENHPYEARPEYLMYHHMKALPAIAIDVPKHLIAVESDTARFSLEDFQVDPAKIDEIAALFAHSLAEYWQDDPERSSEPWS